MRDVVARERDDVGLEAVGYLDGALDLLAAGEGAVVDVGELDDLEAVQFPRQPTESDGVALDGELVRLGEGRACQSVPALKQSCEGESRAFGRHVAVLSSW